MIYLSFNGNDVAYVDDLVAIVCSNDKVAEL